MPTRYKREEIMLMTSNMTFCKLEFEFIIVLQNGKLGVAAVATFSIYSSASSRKA
jgi:hypothetical protein